ncbi:uncharacterized protein LOC131431316 [Malaya genurostris]|uniref:uncharacterized protein LOC131431316 n=1 Tax=Malaya genurostris TaxID=325434 RepID=UPI0026F3DC55|nr:uncharacterized protein LOC131431316 [Malaya genurostris]
MKLHFDSKLCRFPKSHFSFVLNFLLSKQNILTGICSRSLFYLHSNVFAVIYLIVNLGLASYQFLRLMQTPADAPECATEWVLPLQLWQYNFTIRIGGYYTKMAHLLFSIQSLARTLYYVLTSCHQAVLSMVVFVPLYFVMDIVSLITNYKRECPGSGCRKYLLLQSLKLGSTFLFWTHICCFLHNEYASCIFQRR